MGWPLPILNILRNTDRCPTSMSSSSQSSVSSNINVDLSKKNLVFWHHLAPNVQAQHFRLPLLDQSGRYVIETLKEFCVPSEQIQWNLSLCCSVSMRPSEACEWVLFYLYLTKALHLFANIVRIVPLVMDLLCLKFR